MFILSCCVRVFVVGFEYKPPCAAICASVVPPVPRPAPHMSVVISEDQRVRLLRRTARLSRLAGVNRHPPQFVAGDEP